MLHGSELCLTLYDWMMKCIPCIDQYTVMCISTYLCATQWFMPLSRYMPSHAQHWFFRHQNLLVLENSGRYYGKDKIKPPHTLHIVGLVRY